MKSVSVIVAVVCIAALGCSIISVVVPQGNTKRILNTVLGVFVFCTMLVPVKNAIRDFNVNIEIAQESDDLSILADEAYNQAIVIETNAILESTLMSYLEHENLHILSTDIELDSYDDGGIYISGINIYISKDNECFTNQIKRMTKKKFEVEPCVYLR